MSKNENVVTLKDIPLSGLFAFHSDPDKVYQVLAHYWGTLTRYQSIDNPDDGGHILAQTLVYER